MKITHPCCSRIRPQLGLVRFCGLACLSGLACLCGVARCLGQWSSSGKTTFWSCDPNLESKKKCPPLRRNAFFLCLPVLLLALGRRTLKNTWLFDDPAGLSKKCAPLCDETKEPVFRRPSPQNQRSNTSKNKLFFFQYFFHEKLNDSLLEA